MKKINLDDFSRDMTFGSYERLKSDMAYLVRRYRQMEKYNSEELQYFHRIFDIWTEHYALDSDEVTNDE